MVNEVNSEPQELFRNEGKNGIDDTAAGPQSAYRRAGVLNNSSERTFLFPFWQARAQTPRHVCTRQMLYHWPMSPAPKLTFIFSPKAFLEGFEGLVCGLEQQTTSPSAMCLSRHFCVDASEGTVLKNRIGSMCTKDRAESTNPDPRTPKRLVQATHHSWPDDFCKVD